MAAISAFSNDKDAATAATQLAAQLASIKPKLVTYFVSSNYDQKKIAYEIKKYFPKACVIGASSSGEITTGKMLNSSCVAMAFDHHSVEKCHIELCLDITNQDMVRETLESFQTDYNISLSTPSQGEYVGLLLIDGLRKAEEKVMETLSKFTTIPFVGGSAGDDLHFKETYVHFNGFSFTNAAIFALIKPVKGFDIIKTQSFRLLHKQLTATKVDESNRTVIEFDNKPAVIAYAEALGVIPEELPEYFMSNPVGLMIDGSIFVRSPQMLNGDSVVFYCAVKQGMKVELLKSSSIIEDTSKEVNKTIANISNPAGLINFNCILRTLELEQNNKTEEYGALFSNIPTVGFSTYGEQLKGHINQTATMVVIH
jgi:hypothetical protein